MLEQFKAKVFADKIDSLKSYKERELMSSLRSKELDTATCQWAMEIIDSNCIRNVNIDNFSLSSKGMEIIDECSFVTEAHADEKGKEYFFSDVRDESSSKMLMGGFVNGMMGSLMVVNMIGD